jgi:hypothetical protein
LSGLLTMGISFAKFLENANREEKNLTQSAQR